MVVVFPDGDPRLTLLDAIGLKYTRAEITKALFPPEGDPDIVIAAATTTVICGSASSS